jgi:hypothetical protein
MEAVLLALPVAAPQTQEPLQARLQDAVQQLKVYQMEGEIDGKPYIHVLVRRHEVHQLIRSIVSESAPLAAVEEQEQP